MERLSHASRALPLLSAAPFRHRCIPIRASFTLRPLHGKSLPSVNQFFVVLMLDFFGKFLPHVWCFLAIIWRNGHCVEYVCDLTHHWSITGCCCNKHIRNNAEKVKFRIRNSSSGLTIYVFFLYLRETEPKIGSSKRKFAYFSRLVRQLRRSPRRRKQQKKRPRTVLWVGTQYAAGSLIFTLLAATRFSQVHHLCLMTQQFCLLLLGCFNLSLYFWGRCAKKTSCLLLSSKIITILTPHVSICLFSVFKLHDEFRSNVYAFSFVFRK